MQSIQLCQSLTSLLPPSCRSLHALTFQWLQLSQLWNTFTELWQAPAEEVRHPQQCMLLLQRPASPDSFSGSTRYVSRARPGCTRSPTQDLKSTLQLKEGEQMLSTSWEEILQGDAEHDVGLKMSSMSTECKSCTVPDQSTAVLEVKNELLSYPRPPSHSTTSVDPPWVWYNLPPWG